MGWFDKVASKVADAVFWVSDKAESGYESVKSGVNYATGTTARNNFGRAKRIVENAKYDFQVALENLESTKRTSSHEFESLGALRIRIQADQMKSFVDLVKKVNNIEYKEIEIDSSFVEVSKPLVQTIEVSSYEAADLLKDGIQAVSAGTLAGVGAIGAISSFGVASTGTAISTLSGAAATNATLAWLGGGSLAAGGLGVAGGTAVLGGIIAVPLLLTFAASATKKSEKALTEARAQEAEYEVAIKNAELMIAKIECVIERTREVHQTTLSLLGRFNDNLRITEDFIKSKEENKKQLHNEMKIAKEKYARRFFLLRWIDKLRGKVPSFEYENPLDFDNFRYWEQQEFKATISLGFALYSLLKVKILDDDGNISVESNNVRSIKNKF